MEDIEKLNEILERVKGHAAKASRFKAQKVKLRKALIEMSNACKEIRLKSINESKAA